VEVILEQVKITKTPLDIGPNYLKPIQFPILFKFC